ncbi:hypothetical protein LEP1GSC161_1424 [Leptospira santarosai str. CBC1416]|nr:hypothetical protein LEP1GSC179_3251 [Leptospira santarosai str. MOR084]EKS09821.1 hypothetical protein LEP1GSC071_2440 [Leptospira santarosai str. JET]EKT87993.1 hypothetical protein LSS_05116 [Leptospira santarosai serovar Shermani str. LT 821]EMF92587.1 hypothetical protein LEP1GSC005_3243 [Leptospira santarosai str. ST188]EMI69626.1 hypothetical protein LEP1GSC076_2893 [Leptospira sp. Fiocruz LV4135]EMM86299.1 hypothetical protein LEP1GSC039_2098 [Leptospira santarosai str. 2000027870]
MKIPFNFLRINFSFFPELHIPSAYFYENIFFKFYYELFGKSFGFAL